MDTLVKISLLIAVAVVFPVMVGLGIEAFYPSPEIDFSQCEAIYPRPIRVVNENPESRIQNSEEYSVEDELTEEQRAKKFKDADECRERLGEPRKKHDAVVFVIASIIGFVAIAVGALKFSELTGPAGPGLVIGGMATIMYGSVRGFETVDKKWLFGVALLTLVGIVWVSRRWFNTKRD